jgi:hypothetical protein
MVKIVKLHTHPTEVNIEIFASQAKGVAKLHFTNNFDA